MYYLKNGRPRRLSSLTHALVWGKKSNHPPANQAPLMHTHILLALLCAPGALGAWHPSREQKRYLEVHEAQRRELSAYSGKLTDPAWSATLAHVFVSSVDVTNPGSTSAIKCVFFSLSLSLFFFSFRGAAFFFFCFFPCSYSPQALRLFSLPCSPPPTLFLFFSQKKNCARFFPRASHQHPIRTHPFPAALTSSPRPTRTFSRTST